MEQENLYSTAPKLFLVFGPLHGLAAPELTLLRRDKRRTPRGRRWFRRGRGRRGRQAGGRGAFLTSLLPYHITILPSYPVPRGLSGVKGAIRALARPM